MIANAVDDFQYLRPAIAIVLGIIGLKLIGSFAGYELPTSSSLLNLGGLEKTNDIRVLGDAPEHSDLGPGSGEQFIVIALHSHLLQRAGPRIR